MSEATPPANRPEPASEAPSAAPTPPIKPSRRSRWFFILLGVVLVLVVLFFVFRHRASGQAASASAHAHGGANGGGLTVVSTTTAQPGDLDIFVNALGTVTPLNTVSINSRVQGQIMKISYEEGQMVKAGDPLLEIDPGPNQATLTQAQGELDRDNATLRDAQLDLQRYQEAFASNAIPKQQLDTQVALVQQDQGTVKLDQGVLDSAKVQLAYCYITAPISGRVGLRLVDLGNIVQAGASNLVVITQLQPISVIFDVAEDDLPQILKALKKGRKLEVDAFDRDLQNNLATGELETLDNEISPTTGTIQLRAVFSNDDESLFPNQFVNARLLVSTLHDVTLLPNTVIQRNADSSFVYVVGPADTNSPPVAPVDGAGVSPDSSTNQPSVPRPITMQTVTVGPTDGSVSEVDGIDAGTLVVADNFNKLADGITVIARPPPVSTNAPAAHRTHKQKKKDPA